MQERSARHHPGGSYWCCSWTHGKLLGNVALWLRAPPQQQQPKQNKRSRDLSRVTTLQQKTNQYHHHFPAVLFPLCDACISCFAPPPLLLLACCRELSVDCCLLCSVFPPSPVCWSGRCHCLLHGCRQLFLPPLPQNAFCHRAKQRCRSSYHNSSIQLLILRDRNTWELRKDQGWPIYWVSRC